MEISKNDATFWVYKGDKRDKEMPGVWYGWLRLPIRTFQHSTCGKYFTKEGERHKCISQGVTMRKQMKKYRNRAEFKIQKISINYCDAAGRLSKILLEYDVCDMPLTDACKLILNSLGIK